MRYVTINWADESFKIPVHAKDYSDFKKGTKARYQMYRLQSMIAGQYGGIWLRDQA